MRVNDVCKIFAPVTRFPQVCSGNIPLIYLQFTCPESYIQIDSVNYSPSRRCGEYLNAITTDTVAGTVMGSLEH